MANKTSFETVADGDMLSSGYFNGIYNPLQKDTVNTTFSVLSPIGSVVAWLKSYTNTPALSDNWVECNGQTLDDEDSVYDGQTIPNLNGSLGSGLKGYFLRGHSSSGETETSQNLAHTHSLPSTDYDTTPTGGAYSASNDKNERTNTTGSSGGTEARPSNYSVVFIMRVK
jgi:hypothetical protein